MLDPNSTLYSCIKRGADKPDNGQVSGLRLKEAGARNFSLFLGSILFREVVAVAVILYTCGKKMR